ncbi:hypothetical protein QQ045_019319 [Rhodiola kirilowii]
MATGQEARISSKLERNDSTPMDTSSITHSQPLEFSSSEVTILEGHTNEVCTCAWSPAGSVLASGSGDSTARIWTIADGPSRPGSLNGPLNVAVLKHVQLRTHEGNKDVTTLDWNAACKEAKRVYEADVSDLKSMRICAEEIDEVWSGDVEAVPGEESGLKTVFLADGIKAIVDALSSSSVGIHDLDWTELADEILKPFKKEAVLLKEDIRKVEGFTKAGKKNYDNRTEELKVLKFESSA